MLNEDTKATRESQITIGIKCLNNVSDEIHGLVELLETRLEKVLRAQKPSSSGQSIEKPPEEYVPLSLDLRSINSSLRNSVEKLDSILSRLEL